MPPFFLCQFTLVTVGTEKAFNTFCYFQGIVIAKEQRCTIIAKVFYCSSYSQMRTLIFKQKMVMSVLWFGCKNKYIYTVYTVYIVLKCIAILVIYMS